MTLKYIVICGPDLMDHDSQILDLIRQSNKELSHHNQYIRNEILPEKNYGAEQVREIVRQIVDDKRPAIFVTRYEHTVSEFACLVADGTLSRDQVVFRLVKYDANGIWNFKVTEHKMDGTNSFIGDDWPIGILW